MTTKREIKYSFSRMDCYDQCPFKYFLKYYEGHYARSSGIALDFGSLVHSIEERIGNCIKNNEPIPYDSLINEFSTTCRSIQAKYPKDFITPDKTGRTYPEKIEDYKTKGIYRLENFMKEVPWLEIYGTEVKFTFKLNGKELFGGSIDRVFRNKNTGKFFIQDIKTYSEPVPSDKLNDPLQFVVYCLGLKELTGCELTDISCAYDLPLCDLIQAAGSPGFIDRGIAKLNTLFAGVYGEEWTPNPKALCHWCEFAYTNDAADPNTKFLCPYCMLWTREKPTQVKENKWQGMSNHKAIYENFKKQHNVAADYEIKKK